jgi:serine protease
MTSAISAAGEDFKVKRMTAIPSQPEFVPREILVKFEMVEIYSKNPNVEYAEPNAICYAFMVPNDLLYEYQWHFDSAVHGGINMESAWDVQEGGDPSVLIGVLDTGVAYENYRRYVLAPDLAGTSFVPGYDFINNDSHPNDDHSHGTHVTGTIAQTTNNNLGVAGIAFNCSIMPVKVLNAQGSGTAQTLADGLYFAANNSAKVINMSLGWPPGYDPGSTVRDAIAYAYNAGVTLIAASGNDGESAVNYPAAYDDYVIAVGATRYDEAVAYYSNTGSSLDLTAPGGDVTVDQNGDGYGDGVLQQTFDKRPSDFGYWFYQGTSMASPHVVGVAALVIANGVTGPDNVRSALQTTAEDHGDDGWDSEYGWGIVDAAAALGGAPQPLGAISGTVTDAKTLSSIEGATVTDGTRSALTDANGSYTIVDVPAGIYTVTASAGGYENASQSVTVEAGETATADFALTPVPVQTMHMASIDMSTSVRGVNTTASATVKVVDANDIPVGGATVNGTWSGLTGDTDSGITDANGQVTLTSDRVKNASGTFTFTVDDVVLSYWTYDSAANIVTEAFITVPTGTEASAFAGSALSNSPNPANPSTEISYIISQPGQVTLKVYNTLGQVVRTLVDEVKAGGTYTVRWDGRDNRGTEVSSGIYLYRIVAGEYFQTKRVILLR